MISPTGRALGEFAVDGRRVDWGAYDIVISINCSIPTEVVKKYPQVLWAYMIGEANVFQDRVYFGYDVSLNQLNRGLLPNADGIVDFPYTFVGPDCLENIMRIRLGRVSQKSGIYAEVNTTTERPVRSVPHFEPIAKSTGQSIRVHRQHIAENLRELYDAKYYLKVGGRVTRGNGMIEAISCGTLALLKPEDVIVAQLLPKDCWVESVDEASERILFLDSNPSEYERLLQQQRNLLQQFVVDYPLRALRQMARRKKVSLSPNRVLMPSRVLQRAKRVAKAMARALGCLRKRLGASASGGPTEGGFKK
jgi:hypothetical protein